MSLPKNLRIILPILIVVISGFVCYFTVTLLPISNSQESKIEISTEEPTTTSTDTTDDEISEPDDSSDSEQLVGVYDGYVINIAACPYHEELSYYMSHPDEPMPEYLNEWLNMEIARQDFEVQQIADAQEMSEEEAYKDILAEMYEQDNRDDSTYRGYYRNGYVH